MLIGDTVHRFYTASPQSGLRCAMAPCSCFPVINFAKHIAQRRDPDPGNERIGNEDNGMSGAQNDPGPACYAKYAPIASREPVENSTPFLHADVAPRHPFRLDFLRKRSVSLAV
jgi:hypothetical protein